MEDYDERTRAELIQGRCFLIWKENKFVTHEKLSVSEDECILKKHCKICALTEKR